MKRIRYMALAILLLSLLLMTAGAKELPVKEGEVRGQFPDDTVYLMGEWTPTEEDLQTTAEGLEFIKDHEGYVSRPYDDYSQQTIGYGCNVTLAAKYGFSTTYLTRSEAHDLLICVVWEFEQRLDDYLDTYNIRLTEDWQYDALVSFAFNCPDFLGGGNRITRLLKSGDYAENELASAWGIWCHAGGEILAGLVTRRMDEITLFLYGLYDVREPLFCSLEYRGQGTIDNDIEVFRKGEPYGSFTDVEPPVDGYVLDGWYTSAGKQITEETIVQSNLVVTARWRERYDYEILSLEALDSQGEPVEGIPESGFYLAAEVWSGSGTGPSVLLLVTYTDRGQMLDTYFLKAAVPAGNAYSLGVWINNKSGQVGECQAILLDSLSGTKPLCQSAVLK